MNEKTKEKVEAKTTALAEKIRRSYGKVKPGIKTKAFFNIMRLMQKNDWNKADVEYWKEKGWSGKKRPWR